MDFSALKSKRGSNLAALTQKLDNMNKSQGHQKDERIYKPGFDKTAGKGYAVVRFLPNQQDQTFVQLFSHMFQAKNGWYAENSRATIGEEDPVQLSNRLYWNKGEADGNKALQDIARSRKRTTKYFANVYVVKDTITPENEGKVMIYEFGAQIFKKIEAAVKPEFEDDESFDPFDMWAGADFKIKIVGKEMPDRTGKKILVPNYENSEFASPSEFLTSDEEREKVFKQTYELDSLVKVKTFEELATRFKAVTGEEYNALEKAEPGEVAAAKLIDDMQMEQNQVSASAGKSIEPEPELSSDEDDDILQKFMELAGQ